MSLKPKDTKAIETLEINRNLWKFIEIYCCHKFPLISINFYQFLIPQCYSVFNL